jgi:DNA-binding NtrC family response regulator
VRELQTLIFDAASRHKGGALSLEVFEARIRRQRGSPGPAPADAAGGAVQAEEKLVFPDKLPTIRQATDLLVAEAMNRANGNQTIAAGMLGITQQALSKRLKKTDTR